MKKILIKLQEKLRKKIKLLKYLILRKNISPYEKWVLTEGDDKFRFDCPTPPDGIAFDVGGYEGNWTNDMSQKFDCQIFVFEPIKEFAENIRNKFAANPKVKVYDFGLAGETKDVEMSYNRNSSSQFAGSETKQTVHLKKISDFINENGIKKIDALKMNIEGGEYEIMEDLIKNDLIKNIKTFRIQFHNFFPDAETRMNKIQTELAKTHHPIYQYKFVWENWKLNQ
jgi:FkbM family methyltransferase